MIRTYVPLPVIEITQDMISESINTESSYRRSLDGSVGILKFNKANPITMSEYIKYNNTEINQYIEDNLAVWDVVI